jgi:hypothetical protein
VAACGRGDGGGGVGRRVDSGRCGDDGGNATLAEALGVASSRGSRGDGGGGAERGDGGAPVSAMVVQRENSVA